MDRSRVPGRPHDAAPSRAAIKGHPLHPMVIPLPLAALVGLLLADLAFWGTGDPFWARAALWLVGFGMVTGAAAAVLGAVDFFGIAHAREHRMGWVHAIGNASVLVLAVVSWWLRTGDAGAAVLPWGLLLSFVIVAILGVTGWAGGELSYRHRIGVMADPEA
jgi:uncharacterized membrane protein